MIEGNRILLLTLMRACFTFIYEICCRFLADVFIGLKKKLTFDPVLLRMGTVKVFVSYFLCTY